MKNIKSFEKFILEYENFIPRTSIDNPEGMVTNVLGEKDLDEYMFFQNLKTIKEAASMILSLDPKKVNELLRDGHAWAVDHIATSKDDVEEVAGFLKGRLTESLQEAHSTADMHRRYSMTPRWWAAWRLENEEEKKLEINKDVFSKTYEVKDKDGKVLFVFDYARNMVFTNMTPSNFMLKDEITPKEMTDIQDKVEKIKDDLAGVSSKKPKGKETKKEEEAEGEVTTDNTEAEEE